MTKNNKKKSATKIVVKIVKSFLKKKTQSTPEKVKEKIPVTHTTTNKNSLLKPELHKMTQQKATRLKPGKTANTPLPERQHTSRAKSTFPVIAKIGPRYSFKADIPENYNDTYMRAIPRDPQWLFVYWEISKSKRDGIRVSVGEELFSKAKIFLRLVDITDILYTGKNAENYTDIAIDDHVNTWYIKVPMPGRTYLVEYGILIPDGRTFFPVRSNALSIPREGVSPVLDEEWSTVDTPELIRISSGSLQNETIGSSQNRIKMEEDQFTLSYASGSGTGF